MSTTVSTGEQGVQPTAVRDEELLAYLRMSYYRHVDAHLEATLALEAEVRKRLLTICFVPAGFLFLAIVKMGLATRFSEDSVWWFVVLLAVLLVIGSSTWFVAIGRPQRWHSFSFARERRSR